MCSMGRPCVIATRRDVSSQRMAALPVSAAKKIAARRPRATDENRPAGLTPMQSLGVDRSLLRHLSSRIVLSEVVLLNAAIRRVANHGVCAQSEAGRGRALQRLG